MLDVMEMLQSPASLGSDKELSACLSWHACVLFLVLKEGLLSEEVIFWSFLFCFEQFVSPSLVRDGKGGMNP
jgi:hypothetical protein